MKKMLRGATFLLALALAPVLTTGAHDQKGRGRARRQTAVRLDNRNPTPGVARRVRRGRNQTPRVRRGVSVTSVRRQRRDGVGAAAALERGSGHGRIRRRGHGRY